MNLILYFILYPVKAYLPSSIKDDVVDRAYPASLLGMTPAATSHNIRGIHWKSS